MKYRFFHHRRQGSVLAIALILVLLASVSSLLMTKTMIDHQRLNSRRSDTWRAFYLAEAGIAQVQQWALNPDSFALDTTLFTTSGGASDFQAKFANLHSAIHSAQDSYVISESDLDQMDCNRFTTKNGNNLGKITEIRLIAPDVSDPVNCAFKIEATGRTTRGVARKVFSYMTLNPGTTLSLPAALISFNDISVRGNCYTHWGEVWAKSNVRMENKNKYNYLADDPYAIWRTEGLIDEWTGSWKVDVPRNGDISTVQNDMGLHEPYIGRFLQNQTEDDFPSEWPDFDYQTFKDMAMSHGRYYSTDAGGNIYRDGVEDEAHEVDFADEFGVGNQDSDPYDLVFIDTIDGLEPEDDRSNITTISISGNTQGLKGIYYLCANFSSTGVGNPPSLYVEDPDGDTVRLSKIFLNGVLYAAGTVEFGGNSGVYGSVVAGNGFAGHGTPDIYYNRNLANGLELGNGNAGSVFRVVLQDNYGDEY